MWIPGELNIVDFLTRREPQKISVWQSGPEFRERSAVYRIVYQAVKGTNPKPEDHHWLCYDKDH